MFSPPGFILLYVNQGCCNFAHSKEWVKSTTENSIKHDVNNCHVSVTSWSNLTSLNLTTFYSGQSVGPTKLKFGT